MDDIPASPHYAASPHISSLADQITANFVMILIKPFLPCDSRVIIFIIYFTDFIIYRRVC